MRDFGDILRKRGWEVPESERVPPKPPLSVPLRLPTVKRGPKPDCLWSARTDQFGKPVLGTDELPALQQRLEAQGWRVRRQGNELICQPAPLKTEKPKPPGKRLLRRISKDAALAEVMKRFNAEIVDAEDLTK
jgi:hypothetical protein